MGAGTHIYRCLVEALGYVTRIEQIVRARAHCANVGGGAEIADRRKKDASDASDASDKSSLDGRRADPSARREPDANAPSESDHALTALPWVLERTASY